MLTEDGILIESKCEAEMSGGQLGPFQKHCTRQEHLSGSVAGPAPSGGLWDRQPGAENRRPLSTPVEISPEKGYYCVRTLGARGMLSIKDVVAAKKGQVSTDLEGEVVVLNTDSGVYYSLETVGVRVWELIQSPVSIESMRDTIMSEYAVDQERCEADLLSLLEKLRDEGLVEVRD